MAEKLWFLIPELIVFGGAVIVALLGLSRSRLARDLGPAVAAASLIAAAIVTPFLYSAERIADANFIMPVLGQYVKVVVCAVGVMLVMMNAGLVDRRLEAAVASGRAQFDPIRVTRGEFFAFLLLSLTGVMLCCNANDLIWLFLALELTSLPTYVMVAISRGSRRAQEAAVKYFFLGAMAAAIFLYGFALLYGATGTIVLTEMREILADQAGAGSISYLAIIGLILTILGISFKIAAAPMHFYAADVYEGAAAPVTAFIAFAPKVAGMLAIILILATIGWTGHYDFGADGLPKPILTMLWMIAVLTMTLGNIAALLQRSIKRMLAYSSIAHSGYMLLGVIAGPGLGINAVLFYLLAYGIMNSAAFAVLAALERRGMEIETFDDLAGLRNRHPLMAAVMAIAAASLLGVPPLLGFWAKLYLFIAAIDANQIALVVIAALNSAISAWYYLGLVRATLLEKPGPQSETIIATPSIWPRIAGGVMTVAIVLLPLPFILNPLFKSAEAATAGYDEAIDEVRASNAR